MERGLKLFIRLEANLKKSISIMYILKFTFGLLSTGKSSESESFHNRKTVLNQYENFSI